MYSYYLALGVVGHVLCVDIEITGDLAFDVKIRNYSVGARPRGVDVDIPLRFSIGNTDNDRLKVLPPRERLPRVLDDDGGNATSPQRPASDTTGDSSLEASNKLSQDQVVSDVSADEEQQTTRSKRKRRRKRTTPRGSTPAECPYRYPEPWEANAVLSNMMNKLTKLFVMMSRSLVDAARPRTRTGAEAVRLRRHRYKVVSARNHHAFDTIFHNMSTQYKLDYNASRERSVRSQGEGAAGCPTQAAVGRAWRKLLEQAQDTYRAAALRCVDLHLGPWLAARGGSQAHLNAQLSSVNKQLLKDVERIRSEQLRVLCRISTSCADSGRLALGPAHPASESIFNDPHLHWPVTPLRGDLNSVLDAPSSVAIHPQDNKK